MKKKYLLETAKGEWCERETERLFSEEGRSFAKEKTSMGAVYTVEDEDVFRRVAVRVFLSFYKLDVLKEAFPGDDSVIYYALLGCLLSTERESEEEETEKLLKEESAVNLDGLITFDGLRILPAWKGIAQITSRLFSSCNDQNDKASLLIYLLDLREKPGKKIVIKKDGLLVDGKEVPYMRLVSDEDKNLILNVFFHRPEYIETDGVFYLGADALCFLRSLTEIVSDR